MNFKQLEYFSEIVKQGSFSRAAVRLGVAQPTLSRLINNLEEDLGVRLLHRNGHGVTLTDVGEKFLQHSNEALLQIDIAKQEILESKDAPQDNVVVGVPPALAPHLAPPLLKYFQRKFPQAHLRFEEAYSELVQEWLAEGRLDIGVLYAGVTPTAIPGDVLKNERLYLVGSNKSPFRGRKEIDAQELSDLPLILPSHPHTQRILLEQKARQLKFNLNVAQESSGLQVTLALIQSTDMHTIVPIPAVSPQLQKGSLVAVDIVNPDLFCQLVISASTYKPLSKTAQSVLQEIKRLIERG